MSARIVLVVVSMICVVIALCVAPMASWLQALLQWVDGLGMWGPVVLGVAYIVACIAFVPGFILTLGAGALFGVLTGAITISIASTLGATCAFLIARYAARDQVEAWIAAKPRFAAIESAIGQKGWRVILLIRLSPLLPFNVLNYALGLTSISLRDYFFASWVGMFPGTLLYVYVGSLLGDLAQLDAGARTRSGLEWAYYAMGLVATFLVTVYVTRIARKALDGAVS